MAVPALRALCCLLFPMTAIPVKESPTLLDILLLGGAQILVWGGSFFLLSVLADPIGEDTGWPRQWVLGALSLGILVSGLLSPWLGRALARWGGRGLLGASGIIVAAGLLVLAASQHLAVYVLAWVIIGAGMACGLYDALFAALGSLYGVRAHRAISHITLISGLCTTLVWPVMAAMVSQFGWRTACVLYAALLLVSVVPMYRRALPAHRAAAAAATTAGQGGHGLDRGVYWLMSASFTVAAVLMTAMMVQLISLLQARGATLAEAIGLAALLGPAQVGARIVFMAMKTMHPIWPALASVVLTLLGLVLLTVAPAYAAIALLMYGAGNGMRAIVRGTLPLALCEARDYAAVMGRLARPALIGQAATPLVGGLCLQYLGASPTFWVLCVLAGVNVMLTVWLWRRLAAAA